MFAGTASDIGSVLFLDVEGGVLSIAERKSIDVKSVRTIKEIEEVGTLLEANPGEYNTVVIDSLGELQKLDLSIIMEEAHRKNSAQDKDVPSPREWGKTQTHIREIVRFYRDLPCNTIFTCHSKEVSDETIGLTKYLPSLPGKLAGEIAGFVDIVGYMYVKTKRERVNGVNVETPERWMLFESNGKHVVKDRSRTLGKQLANPTVPMLWSMIQEGLGN